MSTQLNAVKQLSEMLNLTELQAEQLLKSHNGNLTDACESVLTSKSTECHPTSFPSSSKQQPNTTTGDIKSNPANANTIDIRDKEDDIQVAISRSLQDSNTDKKQIDDISLEEQDLSRALEASLADNSYNINSFGLWTGMSFVDPKNPYERYRKEGMPVGMKNIGNTCWFSSVIQSLYHIPAFRNLILNYDTKVSFDEPDALNQSSNRLELITELKKLFSLLSNSKRKYLDPTSVVSILKKSFPGAIAGTQQDVSEFTHILMENLEQAVSKDQKLDEELMESGSVDTATSGAISNNPIKRLFYGSTKNEGLNVNTKESFRSLVLRIGQATGQNIHDSLESALNFEAEDETVESMQSWITHLPPVLMIELSRFQYNKKSCLTEKIHDKLLFDPIICMDRYLISNKEETSKRRNKVRCLRKNLNSINAHLRKYLHYNQGSSSLYQILENTLHYVQQSNVNPEEMEGIVESVPSPVPCIGNTDQLGMVSNLLGQWMEDISQTTTRLQNEASDLFTSIGEIYRDDNMNMVPYRLHAVLVHDGGASTGHYWAYIFMPNIISRMFPQKGREEMDIDTDTTFVHPLNNMEQYYEGGTWMKFNDIAIEAVNWDQVVNDSMGSNGHTSGYCLIYVRIPDNDLFGEHSSPLLEELQTYVERENAKFEKELKEWDEKLKLQPSDPIHPNSCALRVASQQPSLLAKDDMELTLKLKKGLEDQIMTLKNDNCSTCNAGLISLPHFMLCMGLLNTEVGEYTLVKHHYQTLQDRSLQLNAQKWKINIETKEKENKLEELENLYSDYLRSALALKISYDYFTSNCITLALETAAEAITLNKLVYQSCNTKFSLDSKLLIGWFIHVLRNLNIEMVDRFIARDDNNLGDLVKSYVLPGLKLLKECKSEFDGVEKIIEDIRENWCAFLSESTGSTKLESILELILDDNCVNNAETLSHHTAKVLSAVPGLVTCNTYNSTVEKIEAILTPPSIQEPINSD